VDIDKVAPYACQDADLTLQLSSLFWPKVKEKKLDSLYRKFELPLIEVLADMEMWGVKIDTNALKKLSSELEYELVHLRKKIYDISGEEFNINSPQQLAHILFDKLSLPASRRTKMTKSYSTNVNILQELAPKYPIAQHTLEYRQLTKLKSGYADSLPLLLNPEIGTQISRGFYPCPRTSFPLSRLFPNRTQGSGPSFERSVPDRNLPS
jgi:DNA polymerase-1